MSDELHIFGGTLVDGTGAAGRRADLLLHEGRVAAVLDPGALEGLDAGAGHTGKVGKGLLGEPQGDAALGEDSPYACDCRHRVVVCRLSSTWAHRSLLMLAVSRLSQHACASA